jgi:transposase-like protein
MGQGSRFSEAYKREAIAKAQASGNISQTARELGISGKSLHTWIKQYGETEAYASTEARPNELAARVRQLEKQLATKDEQIEVLKKAISIVSQAEGSDSQ